MTGPRESCGVIGVRSQNKKDRVFTQIYRGLYALQHRGQESAGVYAFDGEKITGHKEFGLVSRVFPLGTGGVQGFAGIGHVMYSTTATSGLGEMQPFFYKNSQASFALAFNGTISNFLELRSELEKEGVSFKTAADTEILANLIAHNLGGAGDYCEAIKESIQVLDGAYSLVLLNDQGELYGLRDPLGFKPLVLGSVDEDTSVIASESCIMDSLLINFVGAVEPGELIKVGEGGMERTIVAKSDRRARCMFEYVYFSRQDSIFDGIWVQRVRENLGRTLAKDCPTEADIVVPMPDSGRGAGLGYSAESGIPLTEGIIKNRYVGRIFIMPTQKEREEMVRLKLSPVRSIVKNKNIVLIDDSIVRGVTLKYVVKSLKGAGAKSVHVRVSCPPIIAGCYMGIDFPTRRELIASSKSIEEIRMFMDADSLYYNTIEGLVKSIGLPREELCLACLTGEYKLKKSPDVEKLEAVLGNRNGE